MELKDVLSLRNVVRSRIPTENRGTHYNAWVLIWYPDGGNVGHASMFIGDIQETSPYVSWWPQTEDKKIMFGKYPSRISCQGNTSTTTYRSDAHTEGNAPDVVYGLVNLDESAMKIAWHDICHKAGGSSFRTVGKNCADIVSRVINAGLIGSPFRAKAFGCMHGGFLPCTPKRVGIACNYLRDKDVALKISLHAKSLNLNPVKRLLKLR
jgi:hypothetical protein